MTRARDIANFGDGIATADIGDGQITTAKIADGDVTSAKLFSGFANGISMADAWRLTVTATSTTQPLTSWEQCSSETPNGQIGSSMSVSSGTFTFPETGVYLIIFSGDNQVESASTNSVDVKVSTDGGSNYSTRSAAVGRHTNNASAGDSRFTIVAQIILDVTSTADVKVQFFYTGSTSSSLTGDTNANYTVATFIRLGDT